MSTTIGRTTIETPSDTEVVMCRVVRAPRALVFDLHTVPEHVQRWLLGPDGWTMPVCEIDLRVGGRWHWVWRRDDGSEMGMHGTYREVTAPERLVNTESWGEEWPETVNTLTLVEHDGLTTITTTIRYASLEARDRALATGMADGADATYHRLDGYLTELAA